MRAVSLNYRDLLVVKGLYNPKMPLPLVPVSDGVGEVVDAIGAGVTRVEGRRPRRGAVHAGLAGRRADRRPRRRSALGGAVDGLLAEYAVLPEDGVVAVPDHLSDEEAATLPCAAVTAWNAPGRRSATSGRATRCWSRAPAASRCSPCSSPGWPGRA